MSSVHHAAAGCNTFEGQDLSDLLETSERVAKILTEKSLSRAALAELLGVDRTVVHKYLKGSAVPGAIPSLLLSALSATEAERHFWLGNSGLTQAQFELLATALNIAAPITMDGTEIQLLEWWREPQGPIAESVRDVVAELLRPEDEEEGE